MNGSLYNLLVIFFLCFSCFLAGWLTAVYILPGKLLQTNQGTFEAVSQIVEKDDSFRSDKQYLSEKQREEDKKNEKVKKFLPFFEEMVGNIVILFDPYKIDSAVRKNTHLEEIGKFYIKSETKVQIPLKISKMQQENLKYQSEKDRSQDLNTQGELPSPFLSKEDTSKSSTEVRQNEKVEDLQKLQAEYDKKNKDQLLRILEDQKFFTMDGKFSFLANAFSKRDKALEYVENIRNKYPLWSFLIKVHKDHTRVYLGPFKSREKALEFKKIVPFPPFSLDFLEEVSL